MTHATAAAADTIDLRDELGPPVSERSERRDGGHELQAVRVRRARSIDLNEVAELWADCGLVPAGAGFRNEMQRKLLSDPDLFLLAVDTADDGRIVGALLGGFDGRTATVSRLVTHPDRRRRGIAAQLITAFADRLGQVGAASARVVLLDDLPGMRAVWERLGHAAEPDLPVFRLVTPA
jgi:GNAT superfamily N-acetyltransferase